MKMPPCSQFASVAWLVMFSGVLPAAAQVQEAFLKSSNSEAFDQFGVSVAISGTTAVVGAEAEASAARGINGDQGNGAAASGAAYVFVRNGASWSQQAYLKASNADPGDRFGVAVAISGDTIVVGARREGSAASGVNGDQTDNGSAQSGAAYVFVRSGTTWTQQAYLKAGTNAAGDSFGTSVAIGGDLIVVGNQRFEANNPPGSLWVYRRSGGTWSFEARLQPSDRTVVNASGAFDAAGFGATVAVSGDSIVAGCVSHYGPSAFAGSADYAQGVAYIFTRNAGVWQEQPLLRPGAATSTAFVSTVAFGRSVAIEGDTIAVGDSNDGANALGGTSPGLSGSGAAYIFTRSSGVWSRQAFLKASNASQFDQFGRSVALSAGNLVVGASGDDHLGAGLNSSGSEDNSATGTGAAYVFQRSGNTWSQRTFIKASTPAYGDFMGEQVSVSGGLVIVSARNEDSASLGINNGEIPDTATQSGAAYIFSGFGTVQQLADADADGIPDFLETYFGTPLNASNRPPWTVFTSPGQAGLQWPAANPSGVTVTPEWSPDFTTWLASGESKNGIPARTITVSSVGGNTQRATLSTAAGSRAALRLRIAAP